MRLLSLLCLVPLFGCDPLTESTTAPELHAARPTAARPGQHVTLVGDHLGLQGPYDELRLGAVKIHVLQWTNRSLELELPPEYRPGIAEFVVRSGALVSAPLAFEVLPPPEPAPTEAGPVERDAGETDAMGFPRP